MARRRTTATEEVDVMRLLIDPLFGFVGAVMSVFLVQVILSMNSIDRDLVGRLDKATGEIKDLKGAAAKGEAAAGLYTACERDNKNIHRELTSCNERNQVCAKEGIVNAVAIAQYKEKCGGSTENANMIATVEDLKRKCDSAGELAISTAMLPSALVGHPYSVTLAAEGGKRPYHWSLAGQLPPGLELDADRGVISGIAAASGKVDVAVTLRDSSREVAASTRALELPIVATEGVVPEPWYKAVPAWVWASIAGLLISWIGVQRWRRKMWIKQLKEKHGEDGTVSIQLNLREMS